MISSDADPRNRTNLDERSVSSHPIANTSEENVLPNFPQARHVFAFMGFLGFANVYAMRVNLSVAIVAMVNSSAIPHQNTSSGGICHAPSANSSSSVKEGEFVWDESLQGLILGAFFWGYIITNPIGGRLGDLIGGRRVFCFGIFITSFLTLLTPVASRISPYLLIALRVLIGLGEGVTFPSVNAMMSKWIPPLERSRTSSFIYTGAQVGIIVSYPICGYLCNMTFLDGWPLAFYVFGTIGLIWCLLWMLLVHESPNTHPRISAEEKHLILSSLHSQKDHVTSLPVPFKEIATSLPFWAIMAAHVSQNWGFYFLLTELPTYLKNILHLDIKQNSFFSALPYLAMWLFGLLTGFVADILRTKQILSTTNTRKLFNSIGLYGPMVCLVLTGYSGCNTALTLSLLVIGVGLNGAIHSGFMINHLDIASNYAGTLMGLTNCVATIPGFVAPIVVGRFISGQENLEQWRLVFWIAGIVYLVGNTFFVIHSSGEEQPWNTKYLHSGKSEEREESGALLDSPDEEGETFVRA